jgi:1,4-dihydroxy-2-naphthoyl-CoA hydrolase
MSIWFAEPSLPALNALAKDTLIEHLAIEVTAVGDDFITGKMPVDRRTVQPYGLLHGGASVVLSETLGSMAAALCINSAKKLCIGLEINANHVRAARTGYVFGTVRPIHIGGSTHIWQTQIFDEKERLVCISRLTVAILDRKEK